MESHEELQANIQVLIAALRNADGLVRQKARIQLVRIGEPAVDALIQVLKQDDGPSHWEAAKALREIASPKAAPALIEALEDNQFSVRWLAAEALIALGQAGLEPLLEALAERPLSSLMIEGAHHVLHDLLAKNYLLERTADLVRPVFQALEGPEPSVGVPLAASKALSELRRLQRQ
ncbi:HEAT repeat domain-containing protein [Litorilinea aerophila]|nr:HEAT repeat domain-containing protein [Litorilinea aerophila]MCC9076461.1 HEAT repeat domain-containing protein [Litorilinea aerophila]GIV79630.1 MAG: hypothetical protein KatS3mg050_4024 [Litorilinea sp.]